jgi:hypothetical protein
MSSPTAPPSFAPLPAIQNDGGAREFLMSYHWPVPLQEVFIKNLHYTPLRYTLSVMTLGQCVLSMVKSW